MAILTLQNISLAFGDRPLLKELDFTLDKGDRVALIGRNGEGKSSLLKVILGDVIPDDGEIVIDRGYRIASLSQEIPRDLTQTVYDVVAEGIPEVGQKLVQYHQLLLQPEVQMDLDQLGRLQQEIDALDGWSLDQKVMTIITQLALPKDEIIANLSGGWIRRVLLGKALVSEPDLLLLDEPTNHLDIDSKEVLENALIDYEGTLLFVSHDRYFINRIATSVLELSETGGKLYHGNYDYYLEKKLEEEQLKELLNEETNEVVEVKTETKKNFELDKQKQKEKRTLERQVEQLEKELHEMEEAVESIQKEMELPANLEDHEALQKLNETLTSSFKQQEDLLNQWEEVSLALEEF